MIWPICRDKLILKQFLQIMKYDRWLTDATVSVTPSAGNEDKYSCSAATDPKTALIFMLGCWRILYPQQN